MARSARLASYMPGTRTRNEWRMDPNWNDNQPIYRQLRDRMVALILEGALKEGDPLPSVRAVAADYRLARLLSIEPNSIKYLREAARFIGNNHSVVL